MQDSKQKSFTRTFAIETELGEVIQWVVDNLETEDREIPYGGAEPALDVKTETREKYRITITAI